MVADYASRRVLVRYIDGDGQTTNEGKNQLDILKEFRFAVGSLPVSEVTGPTIMSVPSLMVRQGLRRKTVNRRINVFKRMFHWGLANDLVPHEVHAKIQQLRRWSAVMKESRTMARSTPVEKTYVDAILPDLPSPVRAVVKLQSLTAARGGEILSMRLRPR